MALLLIASYFVSRSTTSSVLQMPTPPSVQRVGASEIYPDAKFTPGATNPDITQASIQETICNPNWNARSIRPPSSYTTRLKRRQIEQLGLDGNMRDYEEDHFIPLELGGNPTDPRNLWPESYLSPGAKEKDVVENYLRAQVCGGAMSLAQAQEAIVADWYKVYVQIQK